ncbi:DEAD/DEAH box helicase [Roseivirga misakiensis]|uniref:DEAD-box ATP-dependent RNA helicase RhpA n=1 Tax=Roseivirga misakiensis TaxID=1563681 RepID=A0A1E5T0G0_9BACT|nr:DEAD/DEAH box helicase [Roseivirga misakiensis]OEK04851.1 ATP-dependent RNA helicase RhlE [Roseivirga misakiensis]
MTFKSLGLSQSLLHAIDKVGYDQPSPIQEKVIPVILDRKDVLASAQTGTGKTAGFTLPILEILSQEKQRKRKPIRSLILTPTRELAAQIYDNVNAYSEFLHLDTAVIFGGVKQQAQVRALKNGVDILVATPGRLLDLHNQRLLFLDQIQILVLDEADRMLDMGFLRDIKKILSIIPDRRQNLLFSATFSKQIKELAGSFMYDPEMVEATPENTAVEKIIQKIIHVDKGNKATLLIKMIAEGDWQQVLVFTRTKHGANRLSKKFDQRGITSRAIHGDKSQGARTNALAGFKEGTVRVLVATDIAARGLDIPLLPHVVNYELPNVSEDYVHRIGRTGRAGASGEAISLVTADEMELVLGIEKLLGEKIPSQVIAGFEPKDKVGTHPIKKATQVSKKPKETPKKKKWSYSKNQPSAKNNHPQKPKSKKRRY